MTSWLVPLDALVRKRGGDDAMSIGGKGAGLVFLQRNDFAVPPSWVLPNDAFRSALRQLPPGCEPRSLLRAAGGRAFHARGAEARQELLRAPLPKGLDAELEKLWREVESRAPWGMAVRSSATCEDGALVSMAGLAETRLGVRGPRALGDAIRAVWASITSGRALSYLAAHGVRDVGMAVVLQIMVRAEAAGVMFTRAPDRPTAKERIVNVSFGLGTPVVDGVATPDTLRLDESGNVLEETLATKTRTLVIGDDGPVEIASSDPRRAALPTERRAELAAAARKLESLDDRAWDVEFACDDRRAWIVQARPVTGRGCPEGGTADTIWSSANVGEALPGVATPFTWSIAGAFSEAGFRRAFAALGCSVPKSSRLVGNVHGRFYLNLSEFMHIAAQVPWLDARTLVELGGGWGGDELALQVAHVSKRGFYARLPLTASRLLKEQLRLDDDVARYERTAEKARRAHSALDLAILPDEGLARTIRDLQALLESTGNVMLTCASSALGSHLALKGVLARVAPDEADRLAQWLTTGIHDLESARPAIAMARIAQLARQEPEARAALERAETASLDDLPDGSTRRALASFFELYGDRGVREAELSTPRWREDPRPALTMLRVALRGEAREVEPAIARARAQADAEWSKLEPKVNFLEQTLVRHLVARAQKAARLRERMRAWVTRVLGMLRQAALDADRRLARLCPELASDREMLQRNASGIAAIPSVFFMTVDEVIHALSTARTDLAPLVRARRAEHARDCARPDPPATFVGEPPTVLLPPAGGDSLQGLGACAGVVEGRARVLRGPEEMGNLVPGEILVVHATDVGWAPLFLVAAGIVTELGGPLSHAAIVAREFGVPTVVNVTGATRAIATGEVIRVDGHRGVVERVP